MADGYQDFAHNPIGKFLVKNLGLPNPPYLERYTGGPLVKGTVLVGSAKEGATYKAIQANLKNSGIEFTGVYAPSRKYKGIVFDATGIANVAGLVALQEFFTPVLRGLAACGRVVVVGTSPEDAATEDAAIAARALEGFTRSLGKEVAGGATANLVYVNKGAEKALESTLGFLLSSKSAYVSGQVIRVGATGITTASKFDVEKPLAGKVALVTGSSRGIGLAHAKTLARDGATIIGLDVPPFEEDLKKVTDELGGTYIAASITDADAPKVIADHIKKNHGKVDIIVHNAGITRDKRLRNMKAENWQLVVDISLGAPQRITEQLLKAGLINEGGTVIGTASIAGIAGNNGQTNYAAAKAGVIGWTQQLAKRLADQRISAHAIAPGFIETEMTKTIPLGIREAGRRLNSLSQGGQPVDVAEAAAWLSSPGSEAVSGLVVGVNGQMLLGAN